MKIGTRLKSALLALTTLFVSQVYASHFSGTDITYRNIGPNQYEVTVNAYRDCNGITFGNSIVLNYASVQCGVSSSASLGLVSVTDITPLCPTQPSACNGSGAIGIELYVFRGIINLPPGCTDWILSTNTCCRNAAITNLSSPDTQNIYIQSTLNNTIGLNNSSPTFSNIPQFFGCIGQQINFQQLAFDPDGDSLVYSLIAAQQAPGTSVTYAGGFSGTNPFTVPATINPSTGTITFTPNVAQVAVVAVLIQEYRNGVLIGTIRRDIQFIIRACSNTIPSISGINNAPNVYSTTACEGATVCFDVTASDVNSGQNLNLSYSNTIPGATFTQNGTGTNITGTFCWNIPMNTAGAYSFTINVTDDACPLIGQNSQVFTINVVSNPNPPVDAGLDQNICFGETATLNATTTANPSIISGYSWTPTSTLSSTNTANTVASPVTSTTYTVALTYTDGCIATDNVTVTILSDPLSDVFPSTATACGGSNFVLSGVTNLPGMSFEWFDPSNNSLGTGTISGNQSSLTVTLPTLPGDYDYVLQVTNPSGGCSSTDTATITIGTPPSLPSCVNIYASTTGTVSAAGTQADPTTLQEAIARAACNNAVIKVATGNYIIDNPISLGSFMTIEGGFLEASAWTKTSLAGATTITRSNLNPEGPANAQRLVAFYGNGATGWRLQDLTITTANATVSSGSTYGLHLNGCSDYEVVRTQVIAGNAGQGISGTPGLNGVAGTNGAQGGSGSCDGGDCTFGSGNAGGAGGNGGQGGGGIPGGTGGAAANGVQNNGTAGSPGAGRNGGGGGGGGAGGDECSSNNAGNPGSGGASACVSGGSGGVRGNEGDPGGDGSNGVAGAAGTTGFVGSTGPAGSMVAGFWVPGGQGGTGTDGCGGSGGGGGGGGARQTCAFCDNGPGNGAGGGGGGGQGGTGGTGGFGGGSSYGIVILNNGVNGNIIQGNIVSGSAGAGGLGGNGGLGGAGGTGGPRRTTCTSEIGEGGAGGNGGSGGNGGNGGNGAAGQALPLVFLGGTPLVSNQNTFALAAQPVITAQNVNCVDSDVNFTSGGSVTWNFGANASNPTPTGAAVITQFNTINRYDIVAGSETYAGFHNISFSNSIVPDIQTNATALSADSFIVCTGENVILQSVYSADSYVWNFNGAGANPGDTNYVSTTFSIPGTFPIQLSLTTDCCGNSAPATIYMVVRPVPTPTGSGNVALCSGEATLLTLSNVNPTDSVEWTPTTSFVNLGGGVVNVNPLTTTTYSALVYDTYDFNGQTVLNCPVTENFQVTVNENPAISFSTSPVTCSNDGSLTATVTNATSSYDFSWETGFNETQPNASTLANMGFGNYTVTVTDVSTGCSSVDSANINPSASSPYVYPTSIIATCEGSSAGSATVNVTGGIANYTYVWSNGANGSTATNLPAGNISVTVTDGNGCTHSTTITIPQNDTSSISVTNNGPICQGDDAIFELVAEDGNVLTYNTGGANSTMTFVNDTMYVTISNAQSDVTLNLITLDNGNCLQNLNTSSTVSISIPANLDAGTYSVACADAADINLIGTPPGGTFSGNGVSGTTFDPSAGTSMVYYTFLDINGCTNVDSSLITINPSPAVNGGSDLNICVGDEVTLTATGASNYSWTGGATNGVPFTPALGVSIFVVTGTDANGCSSTDSVIITTNPGPIAGISANITSGLPVLGVNFSNTSFNSSSYSWDFGDFTSQTTTNLNGVSHDFGTPGYYLVVLTAYYGNCTDTASIWIEVLPFPEPEIEAPNVFTPNNDGNNDFYYFMTKHMKSIDVIVLNRWGTPVYEGSGTQDTPPIWDGSLQNGEAATEGVYFYKYEAEGSNGEKLTGHGYIHLER